MTLARPIRNVEPGATAGDARGNQPGVVADCGRNRPLVVGRVSMDSMTSDATGLGDDAPAEGDWIELIGPNQSVDAVAAGAGTIACEILTRLNHRYDRIVIGTPSAGREVPA